MPNIAKQNYPGLVAFYDTRPGNEVGLFYNAPEPHRADETLHGCTPVGCSLLLIKHTKITH